MTFGNVASAGAIKLASMRNDMCRSAGVAGMIGGVRLLFLTLTATALVAGGGGARPRGVPQAKAPLYAPADTFTCLDGSLRLPYAFVNDDYCDCRDGTDEPGTSACLNGVFHCVNAGHEPLDIPSSRVNDGVCDCCDAADEWASGANCQDTCEQLGREARLEAQRRAHLLQAGARLRADIIREGALARAGMKDRLAELRRERSEAEQMKLDKEQLKDEAESLERAALDQYKDIEQDNANEGEQTNQQEAEETFRKFDSNNDGVVDISELQTRSTFDKNRDGVVSEEEAKFFLGENLELPLNGFIESAWPLIKPYLMMEGGLFKPPKDESEQIEDTQKDTEETHEDDEEEEEQEHEEIHDSEEEIADDHHEEDIEQPKPEPQYDEETQRLVNAATEARNHFVQAEKAVRDIDIEIEKLKGMLDKDYGPKEEFATLAGRCLEFTDREYLYKLCPFDRATQQPKSESRETNLGTWGEWVGEEDKYSAMLYSNGMSCWNGPDRSVRVNIQCGLDSRITSVAEPNRCEYVFEMETPAACVDYENETVQQQQEKPGHDEL